MSPSNSSSRQAKRSRATDTVQEKTVHTEAERVKRRRFSKNTSDVEKGTLLSTPETSHKTTNHAVSVIEDALSHDVNQKSISSPEAWRLSNPVAGHYSNLDPIITPDEEYLLVGLETAIHVYSVATSRLFRTLHLGSHQKIIGYRLSPENPEYLYVFTSTGSVSKWDWLSGKQVSSWDTRHKTHSVELCLHGPEEDRHVTLFSLRERKDGKREIAIVLLKDEELHETVIFETNVRINHLKVSGQGRAVVAYGGQNIFLGITSLDSAGLESVQYTWREVVSPVNITCVDIRQDTSPTRAGVQSSKDKKSAESLDLVLGETGGSILIYRDLLAFFGNDTGKNPSPRRLHWHRGPVSAVRWSKDGNYVISGGHESVMLLWQLDTGRKQFLPHLSSPICNIVVSTSGNSYTVKLADNSIMVLSARELQPYATIIGLQLPPKSIKPMDQSLSRPGAPAAVLHPQHPDRLLVAVPASRQTAQEAHSLANSSILQAYDIRTNSHISRQALARTNATVLRVGPEGSEIVAPDISHLNLSQDGKWMATVDNWTPNPQDVKALDLNGAGPGSSTTNYQETFLKFWKWNNPSGLWELVTRIDSPHSSKEGSASILDLASRPNSREFATVGSDAILRFWCPSIKQRSGLKTEQDAEQQLETWKCRNTIDLKGNIGGSEFDGLNAACMSFSQDGSVLAICLQSQSGVSPGLALLVDVQNCNIHYSRIGVYSGHPCGVRFIGCHLIIASRHLVYIWDTVGDIVRTVKSLETESTSSTNESQLLAVNPRTETFAVATQHLQGSSSKRQRKSRVRVYDVQSLSLLSEFPLGKCPVSLLSDPYSGDYVIIDAAANVQRLGCQDKVSQLVTQSQSLTTQLSSGLASLFGSQNQTSLQATVSADTDMASSQIRGLPSIFGDAPAFVLPPASILFKSVVQALSG